MPPNGGGSASFATPFHAFCTPAWSTNCRTRTPLRLGGEERALTVLFADIRDFTAVAETLSAPELTALVNEFFAAMTEPVLQHRGMVDKYIGDSLMAVFGAPLLDGEHALSACRAALGMRGALAALHARWRAAGRPCLEMRIARAAYERVRDSAADHPTQLRRKIAFTELMNWPRSGRLVLAAANCRQPCPLAGDPGSPR